MLRMASIAFAALAIGSAANAQQVKPVTVENFPEVQAVDGVVEVLNLPEVQSVEIVNPAPVSCDQKRVQILGVTSAVYDGDLGGIWGANRKCDAEFPGSYLCNDFDQLRDSTSPPPPPGAMAWIDRPGSGTCSTWSRAHPSFTARQVDTTTGGLVGGEQPCDEEHPLLCCGLR